MIRRGISSLAVEGNILVIIFLDNDLSFIISYFTYYLYLYSMNCS